MILDRVQNHRFQGIKAVRIFPRWVVLTMDFLERDAKKRIPVFRGNPAQNYKNRSRFMILGRLESFLIILND